VLLELDGVGGRDAADGGEVFLDAGLLEAGFGEVLRGADEDSGATLDGGTEGGEVASGFGGEEEDGLLGFGRNGDEGAFVADFLVPGLDTDEPIVGWGIGGAAEEDADEQVVYGLRGREIGMEPEFIAGLEVGDGGDGEGSVATGDADVDAGADEVEARVGGVQREGEQQERQEEQAGAEGHRPSLDAGVWSRLAAAVLGRWSGMATPVAPQRASALATDLTPLLWCRCPCGIPGAIVRICGSELG